MFLREEETEFVFVVFWVFFSGKLFLDKICASHYRLAELNNHEVFVSLAKLLHAPSNKLNVNKITCFWWESRRDKSLCWWNIPPEKRKKLQVRTEATKDRGIVVLLLWENTSSRTPPQKKKNPLKFNMLNEREN